MHAIPLVFYLLTSIHFGPAKDMVQRSGFSATHTLSAPQGKALFDTDELLEVRIKGNIKELMGDRSETPSDHALTISYTDGASEVALPVTMKTRGHFRKSLGGCTYPPLLISFDNSSGKASSLFREQAHLKLVMPCSGDEYVIREWMVYRLQNLLTPLSFRARLVKVTLVDTKSGKASPPFYGMFLEEEKQMARRNALVPVTRKLLPQQCDIDRFTDAAVFEYLIGNTDWSVEYLQNIKLLAKDSLSVPFAVPYDFDLSGIVGAPYAKPAEELQLGSVRTRRYRGYCMKEPGAFDSTVSRFNRIREGVYALYDSCAYLDGAYKKATRKYLDEFYSVINDAGKLKREFGYPCNPNLPGANVVITGLKAQ